MAHQELSLADQYTKLKVPILYFKYNHYPVF